LETGIKSILSFQFAVQELPESCFWKIAEGGSFYQWSLVAYGKRFCSTYGFDYWPMFGEFRPRSIGL
jgi:hypothetical protein